MVIMHQGSIFEFESTSLGTTASGSKSRAAHCWRYCPYSTQITGYNQDARVPEGEKTYHPETEGQLHTYSLGGGIGWACADNACSFFLGDATTEVQQPGRRFVAASGTLKSAEGLSTLSGSVDHSTSGRTIISGTRYHEI